MFQMTLENFDFGPGLPPIYALPAGGTTYQFNPTDFGPAPIFMKLKAGESEASFQARLEAGLRWIEARRIEEKNLRRELLAEEMTNPKEINFSELGFSAEWLDGDGDDDSVEADYLAIAAGSESEIWDEEIELLGVEGVEVEEVDDEENC